MVVCHAHPRRRSDNERNTSRGGMQDRVRFCKLQPTVAALRASCNSCMDVQVSLTKLMRSETRFQDGVSRCSSRGLSVNEHPLLCWSGSRLAHAARTQQDEVAESLLDLLEVGGRLHLTAPLPIDSANQGRAEVYFT